MPATTRELRYAIRKSGQDDMKHLTAQQMEKLGQLLEARTKTLASGVRKELANSDHQHYRDLAGSVTDTADEALAKTLVDLDTAMIDRHVMELRDLDAARGRVHDGTYGICVDCDEPVAFDRLSAYPTAKRCIKCQQQREKRYTHPNTPTL